MSVNPNLATLMNLVEELQDQMTEGKYLEAMNALADLHAGRVRPPPPPPPRAFVLPEGMVELTSEMKERKLRILDANRSWRLPDALRELAHADLWSIVCREWNKEQNPPIPEEQLLRCWPQDARATRHCPDTERWWASRTAEQKTLLAEEALNAQFDRIQERWQEMKNPDLEVCPFISRHSVGVWKDPAKDPRAKWDCVCGSVNLLAKNWRTHEVSEKHMKWVAEGRKVSDCIKKKILENACHVRYTGTYWPHQDPQTVWAKQKKDKNWNPALKVCQGVVCDPMAGICGLKLVWKQPDRLYHPQSLNEWCCHELKGKPWDYKPTDGRWILKTSDPEMKATGRSINLEPFEVPRALPRFPDNGYVRVARCGITGRDIEYMTQADWEVIRSMEE